MSWKEPPFPHKNSGHHQGAGTGVTDDPMQEPLLMEMSRGKNHTVVSRGLGTKYHTRGKGAGLQQQTGIVSQSWRPEVQDQGVSGVVFF